MTHLSYGQLFRVWENNPSGGLDWTLPYMMYVCKLGAFAWDYHDGQIPEEKIKEDRRKYRIKTLPSIFEYYSWLFFFAGYLTGPFARFNEYKTFNDRTMFAEVKGKIPTSYRSTFGKILVAITAFVLLKINAVYNEKYTLTSEFLEKPFLYRVLYIIFTVETGSAKYYYAWFMGEAAANTIGITFNGLDANGEAKWDRTVMVRLYEFKIADCAKGIIDNWNIPCQHWLKYYVFMRLLPVVGFRWAKVLTFLTSAFWHGFYPGYYLFFLSGAFLEPLAQLLRDNFRPFFVNLDGSPKPNKWLYDFAGWVITFWTINYLTIAFRLLNLQDALTAWKSVYFITHVVGALLLILLPIFGRKTKKPKKVE